MKVNNLNSHIEHIVNGYKQQLGFYQQLLELARQQETAALSGEPDPDRVLEGFQQRGEVIQSIIELDQNISQHKEAVMNLLHLKEFRLDKGQDLIHVHLRKELEEQRTTIEQVIRAIIETDLKNEEALKNLMQDVAKELRSIQQYHDIQQTYFDRPEKFPEPRFFDKKK
jgi:hypothetical protein